MAYDAGAGRSGSFTDEVGDHSNTTSMSVGVTLAREAGGLVAVFDVDGFRFQSNVFGNSETPAGRLHIEYTLAPGGRLSERAYENRFDDEEWGVTARLRFDALRDLAVVPLPDEPVGVGACWQVRKRPDELGRTAVVAYRIDDVDGDRLGIDVTVAGTSDDGGLVDGSGSLRVDLGSLVADGRIDGRLRWGASVDSPRRVEFRSSDPGGGAVA